MMVESLIESLVTKVTFYPCKLATPYNLRGTFFSVSLSIEECQDDDGQLMAIAVGNVFDMEKENVEYFLAKILPNVVHNKDIPITEKALFHSHVKSIFSCLGSNVVLQSEYKKICKDDPNTNVSCSSLGMGALGTWHGYPDGRVRGNSQQSSTTIVYSSDDEDSSLSDTDTCLTGVLNESQGDSACIEAKLHCSPLNFPQLVSTNIVASFVEHNLHKTLNSAVPTILINSHCFYISIYDCCRDLLLISNKIVFKNEDELVASGILLLYLTINHR